MSEQKQVKLQEVLMTMSTQLEELDKTVLGLVGHKISIIEENIELRDNMVALQKKCTKMEKSLTGLENKTRHITIPPPRTRRPYDLSRVPKRNKK